MFCKNGDHWSNNCSVQTYASKIKLLSDENRCSRCLNKGHTSRDCKSHKFCSSCNGMHNTALCRGMNDGKQISAKVDKNIENKGYSSNKGDSALKKYSGFIDNSLSESVFLQIATVDVINPNTSDCSKNVNILFDLGSQQTYLSSRLVNRLNLKPSSDISKLSVSVFGSKDVKTVNSAAYNVILTKVDQAGTEFSLHGLAVDHIANGIDNIDFRTIQRCKNLRKLPLAFNADNNKNVSVDILIGADTYYDFVLGELRRENGLVAVRTLFGWTISGSMKDRNTSSTTITSMLSLVEVNNSLEKLWNFESLGVSQDEKNVIYESFNDSIKYDGSRYTVPLPFKQNVVEPPSNWRIKDSKIC